MLVLNHLLLHHFLRQSIWLDLMPSVDPHPGILEPESMRTKAQAQVLARWTHFQHLLPLRVCCWKLCQMNKMFYVPFASCWMPTILLLSSQFMWMLINTKQDVVARDLFFWTNCFIESTAIGCELKVSHTCTLFTLAELLHRYILFAIFYVLMGSAVLSLLSA